MAVVLDVNEMHPFQYDIYESGELPLIKGVPETGNREIIKTENSFHDMDEKSQEYIQFKIMRKFYGRNGKLDMAKCRFFYRPAVELEIIYKGENSNMRYAYLDELPWRANTCWASNTESKTIFDIFDLSEGGNAWL